MKRFILFIVMVFMGITIYAQPHKKGIPTQRTERFFEVSYADFTKYEEEGFMVRPSSCFDNCQYIGQIAICVYPELIETQVPSIYAGGTTQNKYDYAIIPHDDLLKLVVDEAKNRGADGIINLTIEMKELVSSDVIYKGITHNRPVAGGYIIGHMYYIQATCIKRTEH